MPVVAQDITAAPAEVAGVAEAVVNADDEAQVAAPASTTIVIPKLTPVEVELLDPVGSATSQSGDTFRIRLASPIIIDGVEAVPAGAEGMGEVVHAKKRGGSGAGGELILAARYVMVGDRELRLRSTELTAKGLDKTETAMAVGMTVGVFGLMVKGRDVEVRAGRIADAKTAKDFEVERATMPDTANAGEGDMIEQISGDIEEADPEADTGEE